MKLTIKDKNIEPIELRGEWVSLGNGRFHIIQGYRSYTATLVSFDAEAKEAIVRLNGAQYTVKMEDAFDQLLKQMGMESLMTAAVSDVKAPMPGKVIRVMAQPGDDIKKGDDLLVLEAMKMENVLQSPADGSIAEVRVASGDTVEKNTVLVVFG